MISKLTVIGLALIVLQMQATASSIHSPHRFIKKSANKFTTTLLELITNDTQIANENFAFSGLSAWLGLSMTHNGAVGNTKKQIERVLFDNSSGINDENRDEIVRAQQEFIQDLKAEFRVNSSLISKLFVDQLIPMKSRFMENMETGYRSSPQVVKFADSDDATKFINRWIDRETNSTIRDIIMPGEITPLTKVILINAIKFTGIWQTPFDEDFTSPQNFFLQNGQVKQVPTMAKGMTCATGSFDELSADFIQIPIKGDSEVDYDDFDNLTNMIILLPKESSSISHVQRSLNNFNFPQVLRTRRTVQRTRVFLPKFKIETEINFVESMKQLGMTDMFSSVADFSEISDVPLYVSKMVQKQVFEVNEGGVSATAATTISFSFRSFDPNEFRVNRPFLAFLVRKNVVLFSAHVVDPTVF